MSAPEQITIAINEWEAMPEAWRNVFERAVERFEIELEIAGAEPSVWLKGFCKQHGYPVMPPKVALAPRLLWTDGKFEARLGDEAQEIHDLEREENHLTHGEQYDEHHPWQSQIGAKR